MNRHQASQSKLLPNNSSITANSKHTQGTIPITSNNLPSSPKCNRTKANPTTKRPHLNTTPITRATTTKSSKISTTVRNRMFRTISNPNRLTKPTHLNNISHNINLHKQYKVTHNSHKSFHNNTSSSIHNSSSSCNQDMFNTHQLRQIRKATIPSLELKLMKAKSCLQ